MKQLTYAVATVSLLFLISCNNDDKKQPLRAAATAVPVVEIPRKNVTGFTAYPVSIEGRVFSAIRAKVPGYITKVLVDEGQAVKKGQTLFTLETQSLSEDAGAAQANVNVAQVEVDRLKPLVEKGIIGGVQLETAKARLAQARANFNSVTASIGYATIKSPLDGNVGSIEFREGALVSPGDPNPLTTVTDTREVYAFFSVNERDYIDIIQNTKGNSLTEKIKNFPPVSLQLVNGTAYPEEGKVETITGQVNKSTGTVSFRATFPNPNRLLAHGNSGTILIPRLHEGAIVVPQTATFEQQGKTYVYKVQGDSLAVTSAITITDRIENVFVVKDGLKEGDKIVVQGIGKIRDQTVIKPQPVAFDSIVNSLKVVFK